MTKNPIQARLRTEGPPGTREGFGEVVPPSRQCLSAASSENEISRSQGNQGPSPDYHMHDPSCSSSVALAIAEYDEERHNSITPNMNTPVSCPPMIPAGDNVPGGPQSAHIVSGTKRKLNWLTEELAIDEDMPNGNPANSHNTDGNYSQSSSQLNLDDILDEIPQDWEIINQEIRERNKPPKLSPTAKSTRSSLNLVSQNLAGRDIGLPMSHSSHKFKFLKNTIDMRCIGIMALQETHLDQPAADQFDDIYQSWFKLLFSSHPENPTATAGVGFILNKKLIDTEHVLTYDLVPGRAIMISVPWHKGEVLTVLNIYAHNKPHEQNDLWTKLWEKWRDNPNLPFPSVLMGDWNFVEDTKDRLATTQRNANNNTLPNPIPSIPASFQRLKSLFKLEDGWRSTFPDTLHYTCVQYRTNAKTGIKYESRSHLDRIYVTHTV
ncbi:Endonuclease/exonuclease/phosphatase [Mycena sanguinolenta]|nr:Endonuclease/exonuclease/phosphatase [Mycena sanguinolenta]